jgi:large subunit ribosomal protein L4
VVQAFNLGEPKTKEAKAALGRLEATRKVLVVENGENRNLTLGIRNLPGVTLMPTRAVNAFHLLGHDRVLLSEAAARKLSEALAK